MIKKSTRGYEIALLALLGAAYLGLAPVVPAIRRKLGVKATAVEFVWLREEGGVRLALVSLEDGSVLWGRGQTWSECQHTSTLTSGRWTNAVVCDCGERRREMHVEQLDPVLFGVAA